MNAPRRSERLASLPRVSYKETPLPLAWRYRRGDGPARHKPRFTRAFAKGVPFSYRRLDYSLKYHVQLCYDVEYHKIAMRNMWGARDPITHEFWTLISASLCNYWALRPAWVRLLLKARPYALSLSEGHYAKDKSWTFNYKRIRNMRARPVSDSDSDSSSSDEE